MACSGSLLGIISATHALTCFAVITVSSIVILGQLYREERRILFMEPDATLVIVLVFIALGIVYVTQ